MIILFEPVKLAEICPCLLVIHTIFTMKTRNPLVSMRKTALMLRLGNRGISLRTGRM
jgi:hypothetical protein